MQILYNSDSYVVVQFDGSTLERTIQEKQSELKQADAEIEQERASSAHRAAKELARTLWDPSTRASVVARSKRKPSTPISVAQ